MPKRRAAAALATNTSDRRRKEIMSSRFEMACDFEYLPEREIERKRRLALRYREKKIANGPALRRVDAQSIKLSILSSTDRLSALESLMRSLWRLRPSSQSLLK